MKSTHPIMLLTMIGLHILSCDQATIHFPDNSSTGEICSSWYPGGVVPDAGYGEQYAFEEGDTFPCLVWESVRRHKENTWLNIGELYLSAKHEKTTAKALIVVKVGISCIGCYNLIVALANARYALTPRAVMVALTHGDVLYPEVFPLGKAEAIIVGQEGWPTEWYLTNDVENHFSESQFVGIPWITVVNLRDMRVVSSSNSVFSATNVDELIALVEKL